MKKVLSVFILLFISLSLVSCAKTTSISLSTTVLTSEKPTTISLDAVKKDDYYVIQNRYYVEDPDLAGQNYDMYLPLSYANLKTAKVIVFIHGGAWVAGAKTGMGYDHLVANFISDYMGRGDIIFINMNYRLINLTTSSPSMSDERDDIESCLVDAVNYLKAIGIEVSSIAIGGHSAGGHLALYYAYTMADKCPAKLAFVYSLSGPTDLSIDSFSSDVTSIKNALDNNLDYSGYKAKDLFRMLTGLEYTEDNLTLVLNNFIKNCTGAKDESEYKEACANVSPLNLASATSIPSIICQGNGDTTVPYEQSVALYNKLNSLGATATLYTVSSGDHMSTTYYDNLLGCGYLSTFRLYIKLFMD